MIRSLLIANRGEIARRVIRTCRRLGVRAVAVYSDADAGSLHVAEADTAVRLGPAPAADSYLNIPAILAAAKRTGADAVHPGYGFLAENAAFARACADAGLIFIGPPAEAITAMGDKRAARALAARLGVPVLPGYEGPDQSEAALGREALHIGYPLMVKAAAGGGGKGMRLVGAPDELPEALAGARREAAAAFGNGDLLLERALHRPRHVEMQIMADRHGCIVHLGERECSIQRRHQKVIEESPSPAVGAELRAAMGTAAVALAAAIGYSGAGTVEFLLAEDGRFYFLEMNTRLQVEHPVTELVTGLDLVEWQIRVAEGEALPWRQADIAPSGHAIEARLYAEDPAGEFLPAIGQVLLWRPGAEEGVRVDDGIRAGDRVTTHYDPLLAKIIAAGSTRAEAMRRLDSALRRTALLGVTTNRDLLRAVLNHPAFTGGALSTAFIADHLSDWQPDAAADDVALALIAVTLAQWSPTAAGYWRNNPGEPRPFHYRLAGETIEARLYPPTRAAGPLRVILSIDGQERTVTLDHFDPPDMVLTIDGCRRRVVLAEDGDEWWVQGESGTWRAAAVPLLPVPHRAADAGGSLRAPMPGTVLSVLVEPGQLVTEGQPLLKLEAMKMEYTIRTAASGVVEAVFFAPGDSVGADALLVNIRED